MGYIKIKSNAVATGFLSAEIVDELPEVGDTYNGRTILEVMPSPPDAEQDDPEVYQYAIWKLCLQGQVYQYLAIHEADAEKI